MESSPLCLAGTPALVRRMKRTRSRPTDMELFMFNHQVPADTLQAAIEARFCVKASLPVTTDDISLLRFMANSGRGLAVMPEIGVREDVSAGRLGVIRLEETPDVDFFAIYAKSGLHAGVIDEFLS